MDHPEKFSGGLGADTPSDGTIGGLVGKLDMLRLFAAAVQLKASAI
jgi:hypothetical protein